jgi:5,10-methenyltetrahydrofolate synthetase
MLKTDLINLRTTLLAERAERAKKPDFSQIETKIGTFLTQFLIGHAATTSVLALYWPFRKEIDLRSPLLNWAKERPGRQLALPISRSDGHLDFFSWTPSDLMKKSTMGITEPDPSQASVKKLIPDCILMPCVGWGFHHQQYWRLGYGGGFFDRTIENLRPSNPNLICVGIGFDWQELNLQQWQPQAHDQAMNALITDSGFRLSSLS